jgi:hypothetical protein
MVGISSNWEEELEHWLEPFLNCLSTRRGGECVRRMFQQFEQFGRLENQCFASSWPGFPGRPLPGPKFLKKDLVPKRVHRLPKSFVLISIELAIF